MRYILPFIAAAIVFSSWYTANAQAPNKPATQTQKLSANKMLAVRFCEEVINGHNIDLIDSLVAPNYIEHQADRHYRNTRYGLKRGLRNFLKAFPDLHIRNNFITEEGNIVTAQYTMTGTHTGRMYQHRPTKRKINIEGVDIIRIENGKIVEHWGYVEEAKLLRQLRTKLSQMNENDILKTEPTKAGETP